MLARLAVGSVCECECVSVHRGERVGTRFTNAASICVGSLRSSAVCARQVGALQPAGDQAEPAARRGVLEPRQRVQGERSAGRGAGELPARRPAEAGLHRRLHQPGGGARGRRRHGAGGAGLRHRPTL